jgi:regulator of nucleoside diphosphate kinase
VSEQIDITLIPNDFAFLEGLMRQRGDQGDIMGAMLALKLAVASVVPASVIGPDVARLGSRVRFRIDGGETLEKRLVAGVNRHGEALPVSVPHGLALIGMSVGDSNLVPRVDGTSERLTLETVLPGLTIVQGAPRAVEVASVMSIRSASPFMARNSSRFGWSGDDDDPGPSAA